MQSTSHATSTLRPGLQAPSVTSSRLFAALLATTALTAGVQAEHNYLAWGQRYNPTVNSSETAVGVAMDRRGNVAIVGYTRPGATDVIYTAKYDSLTGEKLWQQTFQNGFGNELPADVVCDSEGNVIITGTSPGQNTGFDFITIKYSAANGTVLWSKRYTNPANSSGEDKARRVVVDAADNVIVTGSSVGSSTQEDFLTIKYAKANGNEVWATPTRYNSAGNYADKPASLAVSSNVNGDIAVTGISRVGADTCYYTAKYSGATGAKIWSQTYDGAGNNDDEGTDVAIDPAGNVFVTGKVKNADASYSFHTLAYASASPGTKQWDKDFVAGSGSGGQFVPFIALDQNGGVFVAGTSVYDGFKTTLYTVKYDASNFGAFVWDARSTRPGYTANDHKLIDDAVVGLKVDGVGNPVVGGTFHYFSNGDVNQDDYDFYAVKYSGGSGVQLWDARVDGDVEEGDNSVKAFAMDRVGNIALSGRSQKHDFTSFPEILTVKINHFLLTPGDPIYGPSLTPAAVISAFNVPALADSADLAAKVTVKDGKKVYAAILSQNNGNFAIGLQGQPAPGTATGVFKSFSDPVISPSGTIAFSAKLSGVPATDAAGVWTDAFNSNHALALALQTNKQVPGLPAGVLLKSVTSISLRDNQLAALITIKGTGVTSKDSTVLYSRTLSAGNTTYQMLRTNDPLTVDGVPSNITKLSVYTPPATSPGHGRYQGNGHLVCTATLKDKRTVIVNLGTATTYYLGATNGDAGFVISSAKWKSFGPPAVGGNGGNYAALATLQPKLGGVTTTTDTAIVYSQLGLTNTFDDIAKESGTAPGTNSGISSATYVAFKDPVSNDQGRYAFLATAKGGTFGAAAKTGLWYGTPGAQGLVTHVGDFAPDAGGFATTATFATLTNIALPGGVGSGPLFLGTIKGKIDGKAVSGKNNFGLWGVDSTGFVRQLLRNGDVLGTQTVKKFVLLNSIAGSLNVNRSFNANGGVAALVSFTDKTSSIVYVGLP